MARQVQKKKPQKEPKMVKKVKESKVKQKSVQVKQKKSGNAMLFGIRTKIFICFL